MQIRWRHPTGPSNPIGQLAKADPFAATDGCVLVKNPHEPEPNGYTFLSLCKIYYVENIYSAFTKFPQPSTIRTPPKTWQINIICCTMSISELWNPLLCSFWKHGKTGDHFPPCIPIVMPRSARLFLLPFCANPRIDFQDANVTKNSLHVSCLYGKHYTGRRY